MIKIIYFGTVIGIICIGCNNKSEERISKNKIKESNNNYILLTYIKGGKPGMIDDPKLLIELILAKNFNSEGVDNENHPWHDLEVPLKHEALMKLLEVQNDHFAGSSFTPSNEGVGIDHIVILIKNNQLNRVEILATPQWHPIRKDLAGDAYFVLELLVFERSGKLIGRTPYKEK